MTRGPEIGKCFIQQGALLNKKLEDYIEENDLTDWDQDGEGKGYTTPKDE